MKPKHLFLSLLLAFPLCLWAQNDTLGKKPILNKDSLAQLKWMKSDNNSFWFYYKPTEYFYKNTEFQAIPLENGDYIIYLHEAQKYFQLSGFVGAEKNKEYDIELVTGEPCIFIRSARNRFWVFDQGHYVDNMEQVGLNQERHVYLFRSRVTDKRYWIRESDFLYGPVSKAIAIASE